MQKAIFSGEFQPGDPVLEMSLARMYKVSQTTVREALAKLEHAGFVRHIPHKGTFVTKLSLQELRENLGLRVLLEGLAAMEAARRMIAPDFRKLEKRMQQISDAVAVNAYCELALADLEFHRYIWASSRNKTLYDILDRLAAPLFAFTSMRRSSGHEDLKRVVNSHEYIVSVLKSGDAESIKDTIRFHIENSYTQFLNSSLDRFELVARAERRSG